MINFENIKKIAILCGGNSLETEVSRTHSFNVEKAFSSFGKETKLIELDSFWIEKIKKFDPCFVFIGLYGSPGEDGSVQGALELMGYKYQGSGVLASAIAMNKHVSKIICKNYGVNVAKDVCFAANDIPQKLSDIEISLPFVAKILNGGSSIGVYIIFTEEDWQKNYESIKKYNENVMIEEYIEGREFTVGVFNAKPLGVVEILTGEHEFYNHESKYDEGGSVHIVPANISKELQFRLEKIAIDAHKAIGCNGFSRTDIRYDEKNDLAVYLETNTLPGLGNTSLLPKMAALNGISYNDLVKMMVENSL